MSWNRPSSRKTSPTRGKRLDVAQMLLIAVMPAIAVFLLALFYQKPDQKQSEGQKKKEGSRIKTIVTTNVQVKSANSEKMHFGVPHSEWVKLSHVQKVALGQAAYDAEAAKTDPTYMDRKKAHDAEVAARPFKYMSENVVANIFSLKPSDNVLMYEFHPKMEEDFLKSFSDEIVINETDSDEIKDLKKNMIYLKPQIRKMMEDGHKLSDILDDYRKTIAKAYTLETNLRRELDKIKRTATSVDDVNDFIKAANLMLKDVGVESFTYNLSRGAIKRIQMNAENSGEVKNEN